MTVKLTLMGTENTSVQGAKVSLAGTAWKPIYFGPDGAVASDLTATSSWGLMAIADLRPGTVEISVGPADLICVPTSWGWPSTKASSATAPIEPGFMTHVWMQCHR